MKKGLGKWRKISKLWDIDNSGWKINTRCDYVIVRR
jgi:hypothetical protein